jgi:hypothetical protein
MIKHFFSKVIFLFLLISGCISIYIIIYKNQINKIKINKNKTIVICGDSHTQSGLNDELLKNTINVSQNSEPYLATYNVIKTLRNNNTQINTIILGYSFHSLSDVFEEVVYDEKHKVDFYSRYLPILDFESISLISKHNLPGLIKALPKASNIWITLRNLIKKENIDYNNYRFFGEYYSSKKSNCNIKTITNSIQRHYFNKKKVRGFSSIQEIYLFKIIKFCKKNRIKLFLLNTPISKPYFNRVPIQFKRKYYSFTNTFSKSLTLLDFHDLALENKCYGDGDHINVFGEKIFSLKLDSLLIDKHNLFLHTKK